MTSIIARKFIPISLLAIVFALSTSYTEAKTVVRSGNTVSIAEEQSVEGDFYTAANIINISGQVSEDLVAAGGQITINGPVNEDVFLISGRTDVHGSVGDDLRIISGEVTIAEPVAGDVFVIAGVVNILSTATVSGDVVLYAGQATIEGSVEGNVIGSVELLRVDGMVGGDVDVKVTDFTLGDRAEITGSVRYVSNNLVVQSLDANISGELVRNDPVAETVEVDLRVALVPALSLLFSVLVWYLVSRRTLNSIVGRALVKSPRPILLGFATLFFTPLASGILIASMIGAPVGLVTFVGYVLLLLLSLIAVPSVLGHLLMKAFNQPNAKLSLITLVVGVVGVVLLMLLTFIGQLILVGVMILSLGAMVDLLVRPSLD